MRAQKYCCQFPAFLIIYSCPVHVYHQLVTFKYWQSFLFHSPEHGQTEGYESSEAEENVSRFISSSHHGPSTCQINKLFKAFFP